jgi:hypothetical protein
MTAAASPFSGLGQRGAPSSPPVPDDEHDDFARPSIRRVVDAASAPSVLPTVPITSPFHHPFVPDRSADTEERPAANPPKPEREDTMPKKTEAKARKPRPAKAESPQYLICKHLIEKGDLTREGLVQLVGCDATAFNNAMFSAKKNSRIVFIARTETYRITKTGREWAGIAGLITPRTGAPSTKPRAKAKASAEQGQRPAQNIVHASGAVDILQSDPSERRFMLVEERSFRCAVFSDGGFHLAKGGQEINLTPAEHSEMLRYLERMAEQTA